MALNRDDLARAMIKACRSVPDGQDLAMIALGRAVEDYLVANTDAQYAWSATNPNGVPDPTTSFKAKLSVSGVDFVCRPRDFDDFIAELALWLNNVKIDAESPWSLPTLQSGSGSFTADMLKSMPDPKDVESCMFGAFGKIAEGIIGGWESYFKKSAGGSRSEYVGNASLTSVS